MKTDCITNSRPTGMPDFQAVSCDWRRWDLNYWQHVSDMSKLYATYHVPATGAESTKAAVATTDKILKCMFQLYRYIYSWLSWIYRIFQTYMNEDIRRFNIPVVTKTGQYSSETSDERLGNITIANILNNNVARLGSYAETWLIPRCQKHPVWNIVLGVEKSRYRPTDSNNI